MPWQIGIEANQASSVGSQPYWLRFGCSFRLQCASRVQQTSPAPNVVCIHRYECPLPNIVCLHRLSIKDVKLYGTVRIDLMEQAEGLAITKEQIQTAQTKASTGTTPYTRRPRALLQSPTRTMPPVTQSLYHNQFWCIDVYQSVYCGDCTCTCLGQVAYDMRFDKLLHSAGACRSAGSAVFG